jgi:transcriptional regulator of acetoin/glycerol metabolism
MTTVDAPSAVLLRMREHLLDTGDFSETQTLRPEIAGSWRRCVMNGLSPDVAAQPEAGSVNRDGVLARVARGVLSRRAEQLAGTATGLLVADRTGVVVDRWTGDEGLAKLLDTSGSDRGWLLDEGIAGTNGIGTVLEELKPVQIIGAEHFTDAFHPFSCVGVPIRHPISRRLVGVLNMTCRVEDTNSLLLPFALETAHEIERRLYLGSSGKERLLLERFLQVHKRSNHPVVVLNDQVIIKNPAADRISDEIEQALLWEHASRAIRTASTIEIDMPLKSGRLVRVRCSTVEDGGVPIGAVVEISPGIGTPQARVPTPPTTVRAPLAGLAGSSPAWRQACSQAQRVAHNQAPMLVVGPPGTGKLALVRALFAEDDREGRLTVCDATLQPLEGAAAWLTGVRAAMASPDRIVVLRRIDALESAVVRALCGLMDVAVEGGARLIGTVSSIDDLTGPHRELSDRLSVIDVAVPSLRDRLDDLPALLAALTQRHAPGDPPRWQADAVQTLSRLDYPANVRELENIVRRVLLARPIGDIRATDLPEEIRGRAPRRRLTPLEQIECDAILAAVRRSNGNKSEAAERLGISRATLYRKTRAYGVDLGSTAY